MKFFIAILLIFCLCVGLCGCIKTQDPPTPPEEEIPVPSQNTEPYVMPEEYVEHFAAVAATVAEINAASEFGKLELLQFYGWYGTRDESSLFSRDTEGNSWSANVYPYSSGEYRIIGITIASQTNNLLGFTVQEDIEEAEKILLEYGFEMTKEYSSDIKYQRVYYRYGSYGIKVILDCAGGSTLLETIRISVKDPSSPARDAIL